MSTSFHRVALGFAAAVALAAATLVTVAYPAAPAAAADTFVVDTVSDDGGLAACTGTPGDCSLRGAVGNANGTGTDDVIDFDIPVGSCPGGVCRIALTGGPLEVTQAVTIDGSSQPQNGGPQANVCATEDEPSHMRIELVSSSADPEGATIFLLNHDSGSSTIRGFSFGTDDTVSFTAAIQPTAGSHFVECNHFGLDASGHEPLGLDSFSAQVYIDGTASGVIVGTDGDGVDDVGERNVFGAGGAAVQIDDNNDSVVAGNFFGIAADGETAIDAGHILVNSSSSGNLIGTNEDGVSDGVETNYFGSNKSISLQADTGVDNQVVGNVFGLTPAGTEAGIVSAIAIKEVGAANTGYEVRNNTIASSNSGIDVTGDPGASVLITGNVIGADTEGAPAGNNTGVVLRGSGSHVVADNDILNSNSRGIHLQDTASFDTGSTGNCLVGNKGGVVNETGSQVVFESNWWGRVDGPSGEGPGTGDTVGIDVDFEPWTTVVPARCNRAPEVMEGELSVAEDASIGETVGTVDASDPDGTALDYAITDGDSSGDFSVESDGTITVARALDFETTPGYTLTIEADDGLATDSATVTVDVLDAFETPSTASFGDVPTDDTFFANIEWLAFQGITKGCNPPDNTMFCPDAPVTRGQMAAFMHRALEDVLNPARPVTFKDVQDSVFVADIEWLGATGITKGCNPPANDLYCPDDQVTRGQMAAFLARAFNYTEGVGSDPFTDDDESVFEGDIERLAEAGVTLGCNPPVNDQFCPDAPVTRAQMAAFLYRALEE